MKNENIDKEIEMCTNLLSKFQENLQDCKKDYDFLKSQEEEYGETEDEKMKRLEKEYEIEKKLFDEKCEKKRKMFEERYDKLEEEFPNYFILSKEETEQLNQWTGKKCGIILFDSRIDSWRRHTSVFNSRIEGRSQLVFLVEDTNDNKFGYYLNTRIEPNRYDRWTATDKKTFLFSLQSNGRITGGNGMMKFEIKDTRLGCYGRENSSV